MISEYFYGLPKQINGHNIRTDFRVWLKFSEIMGSNKLDFEKVLQIKNLIFKDNIPSLAAGDIDLLLKFYSCNTNKSVEPTKEILIDYNEDAKLIYQAFLRTFNIDLSEIEYMHWWKFNALVCECMRGTNLGDVVQLRGIDLADIKDEKHRAELAERKNKVFLGYNKR